MIVCCWEGEEAVEFERGGDFNGCFFIGGEVQVERHFSTGAL